MYTFTYNIYIYIYNTYVYTYTYAYTISTVCRYSTRYNILTDIGHRFGHQSGLEESSTRSPPTFQNGFASRVCLLFKNMNVHQVSLRSKFFVKRVPF